jgi:hypothetical protein
LPRDRVKLPNARYAFQFSLPAINELDLGPDNEVFDGSRDQDFPGPRKCGYPSSNVNRQSPKILSSHFALAGVEPNSQLEPIAGCGLGDRLRTSDCSSRAVERSDKAVAGRVHLPPEESTQLFPHCVIVSVKDSSPSLVSEGSGGLRGPDDVGEKDGRQDAVDLDDGAFSCDELGNFVDDRVRRRCETDVSSGQFDQARSFDLVSQEAAVLERNENVFTSVQHERRRLDQR